MSSFSTKDDLCNAALSLLGEPTATPFTGGLTIRDTTCRIHYPQVLARVLKAHRWDFATILHELALSDPQPGIAPFSFPYAYELPAGILRLLDIVHSSGQRIEKFRRVGTLLFLDQEFTTPGDLHLEYVADDPAPADMPHDFADCVVSLLASRLATHLTQNPNAAEQHLTHYREALSAIATIETRETRSNENFSILDIAYNSGSHQARYDA